MKKFAKTMRTVLAYTLAFVMMLGVCSTPIALIAKDFNAGEVFKYVSIGDSMTNGYCFEGYQQGSDSVDFEKGEGVYGYAAYPNLVVKWLEGKYGDVEHTNYDITPHTPIAF